MSQYDFSQLIERAERVLAQLEAWLPPVPPATDWSAHAYRWRKQGTRGWLESVHNIAQIATSDLLHVEEQKKILERNTANFVQGKPANNVLMTGSRGTGKSSLVRAMLHTYAKDGLRLVEVDKEDLADLNDIIKQLENRPERFVIFCDDLSFDAGEPGYKELKSVLDGSVAAPSDNVLIYATSNRRHLMPEYMHENLDPNTQAGEIHPGEAIEEKVSLSERFGIWLSFYPFSQQHYLSIVNYWLKQLGCNQQQIEAAQKEALQWALQRGSRSGRVARQFAQDWAANHV